jgi:hypothetical protein
VKTTIRSTSDPFAGFLQQVLDIVWEYYCVVHDQLERHDHRTYQVCFECGHSYQTAQDLEVAWREAYPDQPVRAAVGIWFCPLCLHDF